MPRGLGDRWFQGRQCHTVARFGVPAIGILVECLAFVNDDLGRLETSPWFEKPVLMYWLAAIGFKLFGVNEAGARFPSALGASISKVVVFCVSR